MKLTFASSKFTDYPLAPLPVQKEESSAGGIFCVISLCFFSPPGRCRVSTLSSAALLGVPRSRSGPAAGSVLPGQARAGPPGRTGGTEISRFCGGTSSPRSTLRFFSTWGPSVGRSLNFARRNSGGAAAVAVSLCPVRRALRPGERPCTVSEVCRRIYSVSPNIYAPRWKKTTTKKTPLKPCSRYKHLQLNEVCVQRRVCLERSRGRVECWKLIKIRLYF